MDKPVHTTAQRYADYKRTFPKKVNARRIALIEKEHSGFTEAERGRSFVGNPEWKAEVERRIHGNLTDAERAELAELTSVVDAWQAASPWQKDRDAFEEEERGRIRTILARLESSEGAPKCD